MDELQKVLEIKADTLLFLLQRNTTAWQTHAQRISQVLEQINSANVPQKTEDGKPTKGALLVQALTLLATEATEFQRLNNFVSEELAALSEQHDVGSSPDEAVNKVVSYIQATNAKFGDMDAEQVKQSLGLHNEPTSH